MKKQKLDNETINNIVNILGKFKELKRRGWILKKCSKQESDAEHSFSLSLLAILLAPAKLDLLRCLKLALIHDLPEIYGNDYIPGEIPLKDKESLEKASIKRISLELKCKELENLFEEFLANQTPESRFINALDKLDNVFMAKYYDDNHQAPQPLVPEFAQTAQQKIAQYPEREIKELQKIINILAN